MAANQSGSGNNIKNAQWAFLGLILGFVVILVVFSLSRSAASGQRGELPALEGKGLQYARSQAKAQEFETVRTHDALGRDRGVSDGKDWVVCFQTPGPGELARYTPIELAVVKLTETCPTTDQGDPYPIHAGDRLPDLTGRTAWWTREALGPDASIRFIDVADEEHEIEGGLGDWKLCVQSIPANSTFNGQPMIAIVTPFENTCTPDSKKDPSPDRMLTDLLNRLAKGELAED
jgi:hypothetical protein